MSKSVEEFLNGLTSNMWTSREQFLERLRTELALLLRKKKPLKGVPFGQLTQLRQFSEWLGTLKVPGAGRESPVVNILPVIEAMSETVADELRPLLADLRVLLMFGDSKGFLAFEPLAGSSGSAKYHLTGKAYKRAAHISQAC